MRLTNRVSLCVQRIESQRYRHIFFILDDHKYIHTHARARVRAGSNTHLVSCIKMGKRKSASSRPTKRKVGRPAPVDSEESSDEELQCQRCGQMVPTVAGLVAHTKACKGGLPEQTSTSFNANESSLCPPAALFKHAGEENSLQHECQSCSKAFRSAKALKIHISRSKPCKGSEATSVPLVQSLSLCQPEDIDSAEPSHEDSTWTCESCKRSFESQKGLQTHGRYCKTTRRSTDSARSAHSGNESYSDSDLSLGEEKAWVCKSCDRSFESQRGLQTHGRYCRGARDPGASSIDLDDSVCAYCFRKFDSAKVLQTHSTCCTKNPFNAGTITDEMFRCDCGRSFESKKKLAAHERFCHAHLAPNKAAIVAPNDSCDEAFSCQWCGRSFDSENGLKTHGRFRKKSCSGKRNTAPDKSFRTVSPNLESNVDENTWICTSCGRSFTSEGGLKTHGRFCDKETHTDNAQEEHTFVCSTCNRSFDSERNLKTHGRFCIIVSTTDGTAATAALKSNNNHEHECASCNRSFDSMRGLQTHVRYCDNASVAKQSASDTNDAQDHHSVPKAGTNSGEVVCPTCGRSFGSMKGLNAHSRFCTDASTTNDTADSVAAVSDEQHRNVCESCGRSFDSVRGLQTHTRYCDKVPVGAESAEDSDDAGEAASIPSRQTHTVGTTPSDENRFICAACSRSFDSNKGLKTHGRFCKNIPAGSNVTETAATSSDMEPEYVCGGCNRSFDSMRGLQTHVRYCDNASVAKQSASDTNDAQDHHSVAKAGTNSGEVVCPTCGRSFGSMKGLNAHSRFCTDASTTNDTADSVAEVSDEQHRNVCESCGRSFDSVRGLQTHTRYCDKVPVGAESAEDSDDAGEAASIPSRQTHTVGTTPNDENRFICAACSRSFDSNKGLKTHGRFCKNIPAGSNVTETAATSSDMEPEYVCGGCNRSFDSMRGLQTHVRYCDNASVAKQSASDTNDAQDHHSVPKAGTNSGEVVCPTCGRSFGSMKGLNAHSRFCTDASTTNDTADSVAAVSDEQHRNVCESCGRSFDSVRGLQTHTRYCDKVPVGAESAEDSDDAGEAASIPSRQTHTVGTTPNDENRFICAACSRSFDSNKGLKTHGRFCKNIPAGSNVTETAATSSDMEPEYVCGVCSRSFDSVRGLQTHARYCSNTKAAVKRTGEPNQTVAATSVVDVGRDTTDSELEFPCGLCERSFDSKKGLKTHRRFCTNVSKVHDTADTVVMSSNDEHNDYEHVCASCSRPFDSVRGLKTHKRFCDVDKESAEDSDDVDGCVSGTTENNESAGGSSSKGECIRTACGRSSDSNNGLRAHDTFCKTISTTPDDSKPIIVSLGVERGFVCDACDRSFAAFRNLITHASFCTQATKLSNGSTNKNMLVSPHTSEYVHHNTPSADQSHPSSQAKIATGPALICPSCDQTFTITEEFQAHALMCQKQNTNVDVDSRQSLARAGNDSFFASRPADPAVVLQQCLHQLRQVHRTEE